MEERMPANFPEVDTDQATTKTSAAGTSTECSPTTHPLQFALFYTLQAVHNIAARSAVVEEAPRLHLSELSSRFEELVGRPVPVKAVGYENLRELVCSFDDLFIVTRDTSVPTYVDTDEAYVLEPRPCPAFFDILLELIKNPENYNFSSSLAWTLDAPLQAHGELFLTGQASSASTGGQNGLINSSPSPAADRTAQESVRDVMKRSAT